MEDVDGGRSAFLAAPKTEKTKLLIIRGQIIRTAERGFIDRRRRTDGEHMGAVLERE